MDFLKLLRAVYLKEDIDTTGIDIGLCLALNKALGKQKENLPVLKKIASFLFYVEPRTYFGMLVLLIPYRSFIPKNMKFIKNEEEELSKKEKDLRDFFGWSDREFKIHRPFLETALMGK